MDNRYALTMAGDTVLAVYEEGGYVIDSSVMEELKFLHISIWKEDIVEDMRMFSEMYGRETVTKRLADRVVQYYPEDIFSGTYNEHIDVKGNTDVVITPFANSVTVNCTDVIGAMVKAGYTVRQEIFLYTDTGMAEHPESQPVIDFRLGYFHHMELHDTQTGYSQYSEYISEPCVCLSLKNIAKHMKKDGSFSSDFNKVVLEDRGDLQELVALAEKHDINMHGFLLVHYRAVDIYIYIYIFSITAECTVARIICVF